jgi:hypothetical protein
MSKLLKALIKEILISEMPFKKLAKKVTNVRKLSDPKGHLPALEKFHSSKKYLKDAEYIFKNFKTDIWIVPSFASTDSLGIGNTRVGILSLEKAKPYLLESGIGLTDQDIENGEKPSPENEERCLKNIQAHLNGNGSIIISSSETLEKDFWPSPWMILHAIGDDVGAGIGNEFHQMFLNLFVNTLKEWFRTTRRQLVNICEDYLYSIYPNGVWPNSEHDHLRLGDIFFDILKLSMTMKSARKRKIAVLSDVIAESFVQAVTHSKGFHLNLSQFDQIADENFKAYELKKDISLVNAVKQYLLEFEEKVNSLKDESFQLLDKMLSGKIVLVSVADSPYHTATNYNEK